jgi:exonuclease III
MGTYKFVTFNCKNVKRSVDNIRDLCKIYDIIALQETWLTNDDLSFLSTISDDFSSTGVSAMDSSTGPLRGRPYGGVALLWRRSVFVNVYVIECDNPRFCAIMVISNKKAFLVMCLYMPTDENPNLAEFTDVLSAVSAIIDNCGVETVYMLGDFNAHPHEQFYYELLNFSSEQNWSCIDFDILGLASSTHTYVSEINGSRRWLDHILCSQAAVNSVQKVYVLYDVFWSDHYPLAMECNLDIVLPTKMKSISLQNEVVWGERTHEQIDLYRHECNKRLRIIGFSPELGNCCDNICCNNSHKIIIDNLYRDIVQALKESSIISKKGHKQKRKVIAGWNKHVADAHGKARLKFQLWELQGKPSIGVVYNEMCEARKIFKSRLKWCQNHEAQIKMDILASHHARGDFSSFWKHTNWLQCRPGQPVSVGGVSEPVGIANMFVERFKVNSPLGPSKSPLDAEPVVERKIAFSIKEIAVAIKSMTKGKSPGHDGLSIEHLKFAGPHLPRVLYLLFGYCLAHSYMPDDMIRTVVTPIIKNKTGDLADKNNYRPISLATVLSKVFDSVLDKHLNNYVKLHDNQFGFRPKLSTESAVLCVKHTISYYVKRKTPVFACFLDLSQAFDLVSYDILWDKLQKAHLPFELINILKYWYRNQVNSVRWDGALSGSYRLDCGVRQGGLSSPTLFNLYVNDLIGELGGARVGCHVDGVCVNNISYADDMVLLSASICGLRRLVSICEEYATSHGLAYNVKKSQVMVFGAGSHRYDNIPHVSINGKKLERVFKLKYLGHVLTPDLKDNEDIERERRALSVRANMLARRFARCSREVKITLFRAFCTSFYTCCLWANYTQKAYGALRVQYNNAFRVLLRLPRFCSASGMFAEAGVDCFYATMRKRCASLVRRVRASGSSVLNLIADRLDCDYINHSCAISGGVVQEWPL